MSFEKPQFKKRYENFIDGDGAEDLPKQFLDAMRHVISPPRRGWLSGIAAR